jgi:protein SCO1/2
MRLRLQTLRLRTLLAALFLTSFSTVGLVGCADKPAAFNSMDVTGAPWGQTFNLPDLDGQPKTPASFTGKVSLVFFGFLYCPDACPAHLTKMMALKERLGPDADKLQLVFITVDPERDQPEALRKFLASFDPRIVGLRGSVEQVQAVAKDFRVFFKKVDTSASKSDPMAYTIDHTTFTYVYDPKGALRLVVPHDITLEKLEADVRALLK